jgi:acyl carrier protein
MTDTVDQQVRQIMALVFNIPTDAIEDDISIMSIPEWDSLGHANLMLALEESFGVQLPADAIVELQSLPDIVAFLASGR